MDIEAALKRILFLAELVEHEAILPFPSHITLTKVAHEITQLTLRLKRELV